MYYYPSVCANMNPSACLDLYPMQDDKTKYFPNEILLHNSTTANNNGNGAMNLTGQQLRQLQYHQMLNTAGGKRSRRDDDEDHSMSTNNTAHEVRKSISDSNIVVHKDMMDTDMSDGDYNSYHNQNHEHNNIKRQFHKTEVPKESQDWPVFQHPNGGVIQFTPHGNIRTYFDEMRGVEVSVMENDSSFLNFGT
ncbi:hypothetical protein DASC09_050330 [Saccharomycopsis crataegensis]|uniref:Uncharacterized protein n=1 Tax=Saccharomycopsis crataegensis TaxID=43959 RepID=A0AAV5QU97_9ASCO|nr:hypothetical protein DASC09_050330 [Saccharomycopsis crataegensis]